VSGAISVPVGLAAFSAPAILMVYPLRASCVMKVRASVKRMCEKCKLIRRKGVVRIICEDPRHKQRQG